MNSTRLRPHLASEPPPPTCRLLRGYAFDPSLATQLDTALVSEIPAGYTSIIHCSEG